MRRQVRTRAVGALLAVIAVVGLTSACEPHTGAAAYVNGTRISESDVDTLVDSAAKPFASTDGATIDPRAYAVRQVVLGDVYARVLQAQGGRPTAAELSAARTAVLSGSSDAELVKVVEGRGFKAPFEGVLVNAQTQFTILRTRLSSATKEQVDILLAKADVKVRINPQYGTWDPTSLSVSNGPAVGDFLRTTASASASAAAS